MNQNDKTLDNIFRDPVLATIEWRAVESLFQSLGCDITEGAGFRVRVALNGVRAVFHRPHPEREIGKHMVRSIREFLSNAGVR